MMQSYSKEARKTPLEYFDRWPGYFGDKAGAIDILVRYDLYDDFFPSNGCCGFIPYSVTAKSMKSIYASLWCRYEDLYSAALEYWDFLLNPEISPFKTSLKGLERVFNDKGQPVAIGVHDMDAPNQTTIGLFMQCRVPQENSNKLRSFKLWRQCGFDIQESFFLSEHLYCLTSGKLCFVGSEYPHGFDPNGRGMSWKAFSTATPKGLSTLSSFARGDTSYYGITSLWSGTKSPLYHTLKGQQKYTGKFSRAFKSLKNYELEFTDHKSVVDTASALKIITDTKADWKAT